MNRAAICEVYYLLEADWNMGGCLQERPSNQRRMEAISVQLHRIGFRPRPNLTFETLDEEQQELYHDLELRWGLISVEEPITKVIFRKWKDNAAIIAIFPEDPGNESPATCASYMHIGQHGSCNYRATILPDTVPAKPEEYADLKKELESSPYFYRFKVYKRYTYAMFEALKAELRRIAHAPGS